MRSDLVTNHEVTEDTENTFPPLATEIRVRCRAYNARVQVWLQGPIGGAGSNGSITQRWRSRPIDGQRSWQKPARMTKNYAAEVESLLAQGASSEGVLTGGAVALAAVLVSDAGRSVLTGRRLGAYQILAPLGAGAMGEVYRARDTRLGRDVAIKIFGCCL